ncbi:MAG: DUF4340 domain-containing protein [Clostridia bacterium]|nr:DUF4340 domain-containing protein [Clostridia bacterium]
MKKTLKLILILVLCLGAVIAGYFAVSRHYAEPEEDDDVISVTAAQFDGEVNTLTWNVDGKDICSLTKKNKWILSTDSSFPVSQTTADGLAESLKTIDAMKLVAAEPGDLDEYGLESPALKVTATLEDGSQITYSFGDKDMYSSGNYFVSSLEKSVYLVDFRVAESFPDDVYRLIEVEELPDLAQFDSLGITSEKAEVSIIKTGNGYNISDGGEEKTVPDDKAEEIHIAAGSVQFDKCVNYKAEYDGYGLNKPSYTLTFTYTLEDGDSEEPVENKLVLKIGLQNGDDYFACVDDGEMIYTLNGSVIEPLLIDSVDSVITESPAENED